MTLWETPTACVTHASTKLSRQFANYFAAKGYALLLTGLDRAALKRIAESIRWEYQVSVNIAILDLTNSNNVQSFLNHWVSDSNIEVFINNTDKLFDPYITPMAPDKDLYTIDLLKNNITNLTTAVANELIGKKSGSLVSITAAENKKVPTALSEYNISFLSQLHKNLNSEIAYTNINRQLLCPMVDGGGIGSITKGKNEQWEEQVVRDCIRGLIQKSPIVKSTSSSPLSSFLAQFLPLRKAGERKRRRTFSTL